MQSENVNGKHSMFPQSGKDISIKHVYFLKTHGSQGCACPPEADCCIDEAL